MTLVKDAKLLMVIHAEDVLPILQASMWIQQDSCPDYMLKAEDCLRAEEERVNNYLHQSSKIKLLEQARHGLAQGS